MVANSLGRGSGCRCLGDVSYGFPFCFLTPVVVVKRHRCTNHRPGVTLGACIVESGTAANAFTRQVVGINVSSCPSLYLIVIGSGKPDALSGSARMQHLQTQGCVLLFRSSRHAQRMAASPLACTACRLKAYIFLRDHFVVAADVALRHTQ